MPRRWIERIMSIAHTRRAITIPELTPPSVGAKHDSPEAIQARIDVSRTVHGIDHVRAGLRRLLPEGHYGCKQKNENGKNAHWEPRRSASLKRGLHSSETGGCQGL